MDLNSDGCVRRSNTLEPGNHLRICSKSEENKENPCRNGRSQDLPDAYRILASTPANESIIVALKVSLT
jgi:hypothetical protein